MNVYGKDLYVIKIFNFILLDTIMRQKTGIFIHTATLWQ